MPAERLHEEVATAAASPQPPSAACLPHEKQETVSIPSSACIDACADTASDAAKSLRRKLANVSHCLCKVGSTVQRKFNCTQVFRY